MKTFWLNNHFARPVIVDVEDYERIRKVSWSFNKRNGQVTGEANGKCTTLARFILGVTDPKIYVDHKDRDKFNNRKKNLRPCNHSQNMQNRGPIRGKKYKGVFFNKRWGKYYVLIRYNGRHRYYGAFSCPIKAAKKYDAVVIKLFGEFAYINFPSDD